MSIALSRAIGRLPVADAAAVPRMIVASPDQPVDVSPDDATAAQRR